MRLLAVHGSVRVKPRPNEIAEAREMCGLLSGSPCALPEDCMRCKMFVCARCERVLSWSNGAADDAPSLCDDCWCWLERVA